MDRQYFAADSSTIQPYVLDDLCSRFIINIPEEEREDLIRIFFQIELAHWFYLDFYCRENSMMKCCGIKTFSEQVFKHCPFLMQHAENVDKVLDQWREYKMAVPTYGAIMLDSTLQYCVLVQGYWAKASWGFPKGKVNEDEPPMNCAIREVLEETGFDISELIDPKSYLQFKVNEQLTGLYIVPNVPMDTKFLPRTRNEIKNVQWFKVEHLPLNKKDLTPKTHLGLYPNAFFMVMPFMKNLRKWLSRQQGKADNNPQDSDMSSTPFSYYKNIKNSRGSVTDVKQVLEKPQKPRSKSQHTISQNSDLFPADNKTEKQRVKQQQYFKQQNLLEYQDYVKSKPKSSRTRSTSPIPRFQKARQQNNSPKQTKQVHILKRDGAVINGSKPRRSLTAQFMEAREEEFRSADNQRQSRKDEFENFCPKAWKNFKFDVDAIMRSIVVR